MNTKCFLIQPDTKKFGKKKKKKQYLSNYSSHNIKIAKIQKHNLHV